MLATEAVGVPAMAPVAAFNCKFAGNVPAVRVQLYGVVPPVAASVPLYATPTCPLGREAVEIAKVVDAIVSVKLTLLDCMGLPESCTRNVTARLFAAAVGVPVIAPVDAFSCKPAGKVPLVVVQLRGSVPPVATSVALYAVPTWPLGRVVVEMASGVGLGLPELEEPHP